MTCRTALAVISVLAVSGAAAAPVDCPTDLCACLGEASSFDVVAGASLKSKTGKERSSGYSYPIATTIADAVCAESATVSGRSDAVTTFGDTTLVAPTGTAASFKAAKVYGGVEPGTLIEGDLVTGGGTIKGAEAVTVTGATDTSGTHPEVSHCGQAMSDAASASATLAALEPTQDLGEIDANGGGASPFVITAGPGVNVIRTPAIYVKPIKVSGYQEGSAVVVEMDAETDAVIIDTAKVSVGQLCEISLAGDGADPSRVVINVSGTGAIKVSKGAIVEPMILAPDGKISVRDGSQASNLYARNVSLKGAEVGGMVDCASPNGAFLDPTTF
jgi:choice-of-anchor A domain-containing protein